MTVSTIYTLSNSVIAYSNDNNAYIEFTMCMEMNGEDPRTIESVRLGNGQIARNKTGLTDAYPVTLTMNEVTEEDRDMLAEAFEDEDNSGMITVTQTQKNSSTIKTRTWVNAIPTKNQNININLAESIKSKRVIITFECDEPEVTYG